MLNSQSCPRLQCVVLLKHTHSMLSLCHTHTHSVRVCCVGCAATAVALTTMSLCFSKKKKCNAADVSRGSDKGEWNVRAIFESKRSHTHQIPCLECQQLLSPLPHRLPVPHRTKPCQPFPSLHTSLCTEVRTVRTIVPVSLGTGPYVYSTL